MIHQHAVETPDKRRNRPYLLNFCANPLPEPHYRYPAGIPSAHYCKLIRSSSTCTFGWQIWLPFHATTRKRVTIVVAWENSSHIPHRQQYHQQMADRKLNSSVDAARCPGSRAKNTGIVPLVMQVCPNCSSQLHANHCKLVCPQCSY